MIQTIKKAAIVLCVFILFCTREDPLTPTLSSDNPCVYPVSVIDGIGTADITIGMSKDEIESRMPVQSIDTLHDKLYYTYEDSCGDNYTIEYSDVKAAKSIQIESQRIRCAQNITPGKNRVDIEAVYGPAFITPVYQSLNALHYDIEGLIFYVDDSTGLESITILPPIELLPVTSGYGSDEINIDKTKEDILSLDYDSVSVKQGDGYEFITLIYDDHLYGIWYSNDTTVSRISFGSRTVCDSVITKRDTKDALEEVYGAPETQFQLESLDQVAYCYVSRGVDFFIDSAGYVCQTVIYPVPVQ